MRVEVLRRSWSGACGGREPEVAVAGKDATQVEGNAKPAAVATDGEPFPPEHTTEERQNRLTHTSIQSTTPSCRISRSQSSPTCSSSCRNVSRTHSSSASHPLSRVASSFLTSRRRITTSCGSGCLPRPTRKTSTGSGNPFGGGGGGTYFLTLGAKRSFFTFFWPRCLGWNAPPSTAASWSTSTESSPSASRAAFLAAFAACFLRVAELALDLPFGAIFGVRRLRERKTLDDLNFKFRAEIVEPRCPRR